MADRLPLISGVLLILLGVILLIEPHFHLDWYFIRSYGFFILGILGWLSGFYYSPPRRIYLSTFIGLIGLYFISGNFGWLYIERGLTISVLTIIAGLSFYPYFFLTSRKWQPLLYGNLILVIGILFLLDYLTVIPSHLFISLVNNYWSVGLIIVGLILLLTSFQQNKKRAARYNSSHA